MRWRIVYILIFLFGLFLVCYPLVNGYLVDSTITDNADRFIQQVEQPKEERPHRQLWEDMKRYNTDLYGNQGGNDYVTPAFTLTDYGLEDNTFGVISIEKLNVTLPIFLGASDRNMAAGAVQLSGTSIPIGGENTNAVIAAHRGWNGASYFLHINKLTQGDIVTVRNLWENLTYVVTDIQLIYPDNGLAIQIQEGKDMLTLMSCHPPGSGGKQRYLVFCERVEVQQWVTESTPVTESPTASTLQTLSL